MIENRTANAPKILLIHPQMRDRGGHIWSHSGRTLPLGLAYIASALEGDGFRIRIADCQLPGINLEYIQNLFNQDPPDLVGISTSTPTARSAFDIANAVKGINKDLPVILGGPHPSALGKKVLENCPAIDVAVLGEGERIARRLFITLCEGKNLGEIPGIAYRSNNGLKATRRTDPITDLNSLPLPSRHLFPVKKYILPAGSYIKTPCINVITSRGCPYNCTFCNKSVHGNTFRARSAHRMVEEIEAVVKDFGAKEISFYEDCFTEDRERILDFCEQLEARNLKIVWRCSTRIDRVDTMLLHAMSSAGCYRIGFGVESGSRKILEKLHKGITLEKTFDTFRLAKREGIETMAYFMLNLPGETQETVRETSRFIKKLNPDFLVYQIAYPFPGTPLRRIVEEQYEVIHEKWNDFDGRCSNDVVFLQNGLTARFLERSFKRILRHFYLRPSYLLKSIVRLRDPSLWLPYFKIFLNIVRLRIND